MAAEVLVGTAVMVVLALAVLLVVARGRGWYSYTPQTSRDDVGWTPRTGTVPGESLLSRPVTWMIAFFSVTGLAIVGVFLFATGSLGGTTTLLLGAVGALVVGYLVGGVYLVARQRGHSNAMAVMESATASGAVFVLLIVVQLVLLG